MWHGAAESVRAPNDAGWTWGEEELHAQLRAEWSLQAPAGGKLRRLTYLHVCLIWNMNNLTEISSSQAAAYKTQQTRQWIRQQKVEHQLSVCLIRVKQTFTQHKSVLHNQLQRRLLPLSRLYLMNMCKRKFNATLLQTAQTYLILLSLKHENKHIPVEWIEGQQQAHFYFHRKLVLLLLCVPVTNCKQNRFCIGSLSLCCRFHFLQFGWKDTSDLCMTY